MPIISMTQRTLETLKPAERQVEYFDSTTRGLALRVSQRSKTWVFSGKLGNRSLRLTLGSFPAMGLKEAREEAEKTRHSIRRGENPLAIRRAKLHAVASERDNSFGALTEKFIELRIRPHRRPRTVEGYQKVFRSKKLAGWGKRPVTLIRRGELIMLRDRLQAAGRHHAARSIMVALSTFFRWLQDSEIVPGNPAARIGLVKSFADLGRNRTPTLQELGNIWRAADVALNEVARTYMKVLILTALRREETAVIRWSWLSLDGSEPLLTIPGEVTKNHKEHEVPLTSPVVELFRALPRLSNEANAFVFTSDGKRHIGGHSKNKVAMDKAMREAKEEVADWRFHDFRRAFSSYTNEHDLADTDTIEAALNHVGHKSGVQRIYDRSKRLAQRRRLMEVWTDAVIATVERGQLATYQKLSLPTLRTSSREALEAISNCLAPNPTATGTTPAYSYLAFMPPKIYPTHWPSKPLTVPDCPGPKCST